MVRLRMWLAIGLVGSLLISTPLHATPDRPLVFVPGILGSVLSGPDGVVWGDRWSLTRYEQLEIADGPADPSDDLKPTGLINSVQILGPWKIKQYNTLLETLRELGYVDNVDLFVFPYDWRQSNFTTAEKLAEFVDSQPGLVGAEFDLLAHSMGGLISRIYLKEHDADRRVRRLVTMATPYQGSLNSVATLTEGWGFIENWMAGGIGTIQRVSLSFPSLYELLPSYQYCCIYGAPSDQDRLPFNIVDPAGWGLLSWVPSDYTSAETQARVGAVLDKVRELKELVAEPVPPYVQFFAIAGDRIATKAQMYVSKSKNAVVQWDKHSGDGTVIVWSASNGNPAQAFVSLAEHGTVFNDTSAKVSLGRIFAGGMMLPDDYRSSPPLIAMTRDGAPVRIDTIEVDAEPDVVRVGQTFDVTVILRSEPGSPVGEIDVSVVVNDGTGVSNAVKALLDGSQRGDGGSSSATYKTETYATTHPDVHEVIVTIPNVGTLRDFVAVLPGEE